MYYVTCGNLTLEAYNIKEVYYYGANDIIQETLTITIAPEEDLNTLAEKIAEQSFETIVITNDNNFMKNFNGYYINGMSDDFTPEGRIMSLIFDKNKPVEEEIIEEELPEEEHPENIVHEDVGLG